MSQRLVIGYGNTLRGDAGAGGPIPEALQPPALPQLYGTAVLPPHPALRRTCPLLVPREPRGRPRHALQRYGLDAPGGFDGR